jgi:hypothetical protein
MLAQGRDRAHLWHCSPTSTTHRGGPDASQSSISGDRTRPVSKSRFWNLSILNRMLGDGESGQVTRHGVLCACEDPLGANGNIQMVGTHGAWRVTTAESSQTADCPMKGPTGM